MIPDDRKVDPGGRDGCRSPVPWDGSEDHGWAPAGDTEPWLPFPPESRHRNHLDLRADPASILHLYRRALALRHRSPALRLGGFGLVDLADGVLAYERFSADESWVVAINLTGDPVDVSGTDPVGLVGLPVALSTDATLEGRPFTGSLAGDEAVVVARHPSRA